MTIRGHRRDRRQAVGVQWHPEVLTHRAEHAPPIRALVDAARPAPALALALAA